MTTAAEQYRALVAKLEEIADPRSQSERDAQMANVKAAYQDYQDAEAKAKPAAKPVTQPTAQTAAGAADIKKLQTLLNQKGAKLAVDGQFGPETLAAIIKHFEAEATLPQAQQPAAPAQPAPQAAAAAPSGPVGPWDKGGLFNR